MMQYYYRLRYYISPFERYQIYIQRVPDNKNSMEALLTNLLDSRVCPMSIQKNVKTHSTDRHIWKVKFIGHVMRGTPCTSMWVSTNYTNIFYISTYSRTCKAVNIVEERSQYFAEMGCFCFKGRMKKRRNKKFITQKIMLLLFGYWYWCWYTYC